MPDILSGRSCGWQGRPFSGIAGVLLLAGSLALAFGERPGRPLEQIVVYRSGTDGYHTYRIPALIVSRKGTLLAFCEGRRNSSADSGDIALLVKRSSDNGRTWSPARVVS
jgi:sialidase-1